MLGQIFEFIMGILNSTVDPATAGIVDQIFDFILGIVGA